MPDTLLLIDDNPKNLRLMQTVLKARGYAVQCADSGAEALSLLETSLPDLVLCDIQMPDMDGTEVARRVRIAPRTCALPLIAITALAMKGDRERVLAAGFDAYLAKPYAIGDLTALVHETLQVHRERSS